MKTDRLTYADNLSFLNDFLHKSRTTDRENLINSLIHLATMVVQSGLVKQTDRETTEILACYTAADSLQRCTFDLENKIREGEHEAALLEDIGRSNEDLQ